jgi:peptide/nickel transport system permease protein
MVTREGLRFTASRISGTLKLVVKNRMALVGLFLLGGFIFSALGAPLLSPYDPTQTHISGVLAQPEWVMNYPDGYYLSKNVVVVSDPLFTSPSAVQAWTLTAAPSVLANVQESYNSVVTSSVDSRGSLQLTYTGSTPGVVSLTQSFQFPYRGPPENFAAGMRYLVSGGSPGTPVNVRLFIERLQPDVQYFDFPLHTTPRGTTTVGINVNDTATGKWLPEPSLVLDGKVPVVQSYMGTTNTGLQAPKVVFSASGSYNYGVQVTFYGPSTINLDHLQLKVLGTAWGLLGTDYAGSDVYAQFIYGARISLLVGLLSAGIGISLGLVVGLLAGFLGRFVDEVLMRFTDMMLVIPGLPLLIVLVAVLGPNIWNLIIIIGFLGWMGFARIVRSQVLTIRERPFVEAARASGAGPGRIILKHVFPNLVSLTYVNLALTVPGAILSESALAFLGLSDPSVTSWGHMFQNLLVSGDLVRFPPTWWWVLPPGFGIALVSLSFILIGYALDEIFNPRLRKRR